MKNLFLALTIMTTLITSSTYCSQAYSLSKSTTWTAVTALATLAGAMTSGWVARHYWDKYQLEQRKHKGEPIYRKVPKGENDLTLKDGTTVALATNVDERNFLNRFRERYKTTSLALAATGAIVALWGIKSLLTTK